MGEAVLAEGAWNFQPGQVRFLVWEADNRPVFRLINVQHSQSEQGAWLDLGIFHT